MRKKKKEVINLSKVEDSKNEYSIYDYLKNNPSVFITCVTAIVALITILAKIITYVSECKKLNFWEIDLSYAQFGGESIVYSVIFAMLYTFFSSMATFLFVSTYDAYLSYKKIFLILKYYKSSSKTIIKEMQLRYRRDNNDDEAKRYLDSMDSMCSSGKEVKEIARKDLWSSSFPIIVFSTMSSLFFVVCCGTTSNINIWLLVLVFISMQMAMMWAGALVRSKFTINKKTLKKESRDIDFVSQKIEERNFKSFPMEELRNSGIVSFLKNFNIVIVVMTLLINCIMLSVSYSLTPIRFKKTDVSCQITYIDNTTYAIVYQRDNQYFLEEAQIETTVDDDKYNLIVYTDRQRIITTDDIIVFVDVYDEIKREHQGK